MKTLFPILVLTTLSPSQQRITVTPERCTTGVIGTVRSNMGWWQPVPDEWRDVRDWSEAAICGRATVEGTELVVFADDPDEHGQPARVWCLDPNGEVLRDAALRWRKAGQYGIGDAVLPGREGLGVSLVRTEAGRCSGSLTGKVVFRAEFEVFGEPRVAYFADGDFDGTLASRADLWVAGPKAHVESLKLSNPGSDLRLLSEGWCLGDESLWVAEVDAGAIVIEIKDGGIRSRLRRQHAERVNRAIVGDGENDRDDFRKEHGHATGRPYVDKPVSWHHALDFDEALAFAKVEGKPLLIEFTSRSCGWCTYLTWATLPDAEVDRRLRAFTRTKLNLELDPSKTFERLKLGGVPCTVVFDDDGEEVARLAGCVGPVKYAEFLASHSKE